ETLPGFGEEAAGAVVEPVDLGAPRRADAIEDDLRDAAGVSLGVGERQRRTPGVAEQQPAIDAEVRAQPLHVGDQVGGGVGAEVGGRVTRVRRAASAPSLIEEHDAVTARVEQPRHSGTGSGAWTAVHDGRGLARRFPYTAQRTRWPSPTSSMP